MAARPRLGVVGSCNVDLVVRCARLPRAGETVLGGDVGRLPGGKGANQAAAASRLGAHVTLVGAVGADESGQWLLAGLAILGVDTSRIVRGARPTGTAFITVADDGENEIVVSPGANREIDLGDVDFDAFDVVMAQMEIAPAVVADAAARGRPFILNAAPARHVDPDTIARCAVVIANEREAEMLDLGAIERCVMTLGARGAVHLERGREVHRVGALSMETIDTVGAGDVFCAAYGVQYALGAAPFEALRFAVAAGSLATRALGAQGALPDRAEVDSWLARAS